MSKTIEAQSKVAESHRRLEGSHPRICSFGSDRRRRGRRGRHVPPTRCASLARMEADRTQQNRVNDRPWNRFNDEHTTTRRQTARLRSARTILGRRHIRDAPIRLPNGIADALERFSGCKGDAFRLHEAGNRPHQRQP